MDSNRFDSLTRSIGSRRTVLSGALAALLGWTATEETEAQPKSRRRQCKGGKKLCRGRCVSKRKCCRDSECPRGAFCSNSGNCICTTECCKNSDCETGSRCLKNGSCAKICNFSTLLCPGDCPCSFQTAENQQHCVESRGTCDGISKKCTSSAQCPEGQQCQQTPCGPDNTVVLRCFPLCRQ